MTCVYEGLEMEQAKFISPQSKFTSELDMSDPNDREEMNKRVYGRDYRRDLDNNPVPQDATSDFAIRNTLAKADRLTQHLFSIETRGEGMAAANKEAKRIVALNSKYAPPLDRWLRYTPPEQVPRVSDI